ncbi:hypothetical protein [Clostridium sp.]|uniref:hypothetical protein n=1 Tax=Clostridium sp. TaxID=1506 RepID=UPI001D92C07A|nr:hypothetical protein [Clostridium sp.]MBS5986011.1 hypothetical protein [Clostridium sp.]
MNKEKALTQLKDLLYSFENFEEVETKSEDVQALKYAVDELEKTAPEVEVQEQIKFYDNGKYIYEKDADKICIEILKIIQKYRINFGLSKMILKKSIDLMEDNSFVNIENE